MAIVQKFIYESDNLGEFISILGSIIPILFKPGCNENEEYHYMYYNLSKCPRYWQLVNDVSENRMSIIALTHHRSEPSDVNENSILMDFKKIESTRSELKWKKKSYKNIIDIY